MYPLILVPLDGSAFAERALSVATTMAARHDAALRLVAAHSVLIRPLEVQGAPVYDTRFDDDRRRELAAYLARVAERVQPSVARGVTHAVLDVPGESVAQAIGEEATRCNAGLIVLETHGRGGFSRAWLGSVTTELVRCAPVPILVLRSSEQEPADTVRPTGEIHHVLLPLDGSPLAEAAVDPAMAAAAPFGAAFTVLHVVRTADSLLPYDQTFWTPAEQEFLDSERQLAEDRVRNVVHRLRAAGREVEGQVLLEPDPARAILRVAAEQGADLIAMSTHARAGVSRLFLGSVTDKVIRGADVPVLVVRPGQ